jgi:RNA polymerase sigma-70 factor (ECF subfamily)
MEERYDRHRAELVAFLCKRVARQEAEELAQEVWLKVAKAAPDCPDDAAFRAYLFTVARRQLVDHYRRAAARPRLVPLDGGAEAAAHGGPDGMIGAADVLGVVERELGGMKPEVAEVFRLRLTEDVSFQEIASRQGTPLNTALGRMHRATKRIAEALAEVGLFAKEDR